ncbi:MAG: hypothetical protein U1D55_10755 [Phycisphaerae bacterium]
MGSFWLPPFVFGVLLVLLGVLIINNPALLSYIIAAAFILGGVLAMSLAWTMRKNVSYRRVDFVSHDQDMR